MLTQWSCRLRLHTTVKVTTCALYLLHLLLFTKQHTHTHSAYESRHLSTVQTGTDAHRLTVELVDQGQVGEDAGQLIRVQHRPHLLEEDLVQDSQGPEVGGLGGEQL